MKKKYIIYLFQISKKGSLIYLDQKLHKNNIPIDKDLVENDDGNAMTLCPDGSYPHYVWK